MSNWRYTAYKLQKLYREQSGSRVERSWLHCAEWFVDFIAAVEPEARLCLESLILAPNDVDAAKRVKAVTRTIFFIVFSSH